MQGQESTAKRTIIKMALGIALLVGALEILIEPTTVRAQQTAHPQIVSFSVGPDQTLNYPSSSTSSPYLLNLPDEHVTMIPPASSSSPYLIFGASAISTGWGGTDVLQSMDLQNFTFATGLGYSPQVMTSPVAISQCNATYDTEFDEGYAAAGSVIQDPTLPPGNLVMIYEAENHCPGGVNNTLASYTSVGFTRSLDNGKTWPAPENGPVGGTSRYAVLQPSTSMSVAAGANVGNAIPSAYVDKSLDGNYYVYAVYDYYGPSADGKVRVARAQLGQTNVSFLKWYNGSFSQPGLGGLDSAPGSACPGNGYQDAPQISYNDDLGLYLLTLICKGPQTNAWYYATATSLDLQDWTPLQIIANSEFLTSTCAGDAGFMFDGWYPSLMSPNAAAGHTKLTGQVFYLQGCLVGQNSTATPRLFASRTFTITTQPQPAPVLTSGSLANAATYISGGLVPGSWAEVKGTGLSNVTRVWNAFDFLDLGNYLPTSLSNVQVTVNSMAAAVYYISPTQINFQVPTGVTGTASVQVINNGAASNTLTASAAASSPGLFPNPLNGVNYPAAVFALSGGYPGDPSVSSVYRNAAPGNIIALFATGLATEPGGVIPTAQGISGVTVTIGSVTVPADYAGQTPSVGEFQINFTVPAQFATMPAGNYPISIALNGVSSPTTINSTPPGLIVLPVKPN